MIKIMVFGTFDLIHPGHVFFLNTAKKLGDKLTVLVSNDNNVKKIKGKKPVNNQKTRAFMISSLKPVDEVILGKNTTDFFKIIKTTKPNIIALGYDQKINEKELKEKIKKFNLKTKILRLKPFNEKKFKSSLLKEKIKKIN